MSSTDAAADEVANYHRAAMRRIEELLVQAVAARNTLERGQRPHAHALVMKARAVEEAVRPVAGGAGRLRAAGRFVMHGWTDWALAQVTPTYEGQVSAERARLVLDRAGPARRPGGQVLAVGAAHRGRIARRGAAPLRAPRVARAGRRGALSRTLATAGIRWSAGNYWAHRWPPQGGPVVAPHEGARGGPALWPPSGGLALAPPTRGRGGPRGGPMGGPVPSP